jgi:UDP-glucose 4-epimerase
VLVTGGAGFIGSRLVCRLLSSGRECLVLDNLSRGTPAPGPHPHLKLAGFDICDRPSVVASFQEFRPDVVVHLAAVHHIPTCERDPAAALNTNIVGFQTILDAAALIECPKVILASSGAVYSWQNSALVENRTPTHATDIYSLSKLTNERQIELWADKTRVSGWIARIFNTIGENDPNGHLIPDVLRQLDSRTARAKIKLGNLSTRRDYIYVQDTAACLCAMVDGETSPGIECFNIGTGVEHSVRELVELMAQSVGRPIDIDIDPQRVRRVDRPSQLAEMTKTRARFGWKPAYSLQQALASIISHHERTRAKNTDDPLVAASSVAVI